jgi:hypothetical protein
MSERTDDHENSPEPDATPVAPAPAGVAPSATGVVLGDASDAKVAEPAPEAEEQA